MWKKKRVGRHSPYYLFIYLLCTCSCLLSGRTGVLILMETALCLMEANEPVYPLDIVKTMRDQRAMMIQTTVSTKRRPLIKIL